MKRIIFITVTALLICVFGITALANTENSDSVTVRVTICDGSGALALPHAKVSVTDADGDGALTINDALICAHEEYFEGGSSGYGFEHTYYGISLTKLWGVENGGAYGYYLNNESPQSLADALEDGDLVSAFVYTDLVYWSDLYCYFDRQQAELICGEEITLTLLSAGFDEGFMPTVLPVSDAYITVNGEKTDAVTDESGRASLTLDGEGEYIISAVSEGQNLVPPVCIATVSMPQEAPPTADPAPLFLAAAVCLLLLALVLMPSRRKIQR